MEFSVVHSPRAVRDTTGSCGDLIEYPSRRQGFGSLHADFSYRQPRDDRTHQVLLPRLFGHQDRGFAGRRDIEVIFVSLRGDMAKYSE